MGGTPLGGLDNKEREKLKTNRKYVEKTWRKRAAGSMGVMATIPMSAVPYESDIDIWNKLDKRFRVLETLTDHCIKGSARSLIVHGPAGLGKSYTVEKALNSWDPDERYHTIIKGGSTKIGLLKTLYQYRNKKNVVVFDDCDSILLDLDCISILKAACDTTETRKISYLSNDKIPAEGEAGTIPSTWVFDGTVIFITNTDFENTAKKLQDHTSAMISRSHYISLAMNTRRDYIIRIKQVVTQGLFNQLKLTQTMIKDVMDYIDEHQDNLRELSLRMALKLGALRKDSPDVWQDLADVTCTRSS
jgi:hypothetical protein